MNLGAAIKKIRKNKHLKQKDLALICGITPTYLSQIEGNIKDPNLSVLRTISTKLEVPLPILFFLSIDNNDIRDDRKELYQAIVKPLSDIIGKTFLTND